MSTPAEPMPCTECRVPTRERVLDYDGAGTGWFPLHNVCPVATRHDAVIVRGTAGTDMPCTTAKQWARLYAIGNSGNNVPRADVHAYASRILDRLASLPGGATMRDIRAAANEVK